MNNCKVCFSSIKNQGMNALIKNRSICQKCYNEFEVIYKYEKIEEVDTLFLYNYNDYLKKLIYQFKGCYDIELRSVFLERHLMFLKLIYQGYHLVCVPSSKNDDKVRCFNHVEEIFSFMKLPMEKCLEKINDEKQSNRKRNERRKIKNNIKLINGEALENKKVLIVDDIYTTGNTLKTCIELVKECKPKKIKALVVCKNCRNSVNFLDRK